jgi:hypothetical protein
MSWIPVEEISDDDKFYKGKAFKKKLAGLESMYMIFPFVGENEYVSLVCISGGEVGEILCSFKKDGQYEFDGKIYEKYIVTGKAIKETLKNYPGQFLVNLKPRYILA